MDGYSGIETIGAIITFLSKVWTLGLIIVMFGLFIYFNAKIKSSESKISGMIILCTLLFTSLYSINLRYQVYKSQSLDYIDIALIKKAYKKEERITKFMLLQSEYLFEREKVLQLIKINNKDTQ